jgi:hypothetical protein
LSLYDHFIYQFSQYERQLGSCPEPAMLISCQNNILSAFLAKGPWFVEIGSSSLFITPRTTSFWLSIFNQAKPPMVWSLSALIDFDCFPSSTKTFAFGPI